MSLNLNFKLRRKVLGSEGLFVDHREATTVAILFEWKFNEKLKFYKIKMSHLLWLIWIYQEFHLIFLARPSKTTISNLLSMLAVVDDFLWESFSCFIFNALTWVAVEAFCCDLLARNAIWRLNSGKYCSPFYSQDSCVLKIFLDIGSLNAIFKLKSHKIGDVREEARKMFYGNFINENSF